MPTTTEIKECNTCATWNTKYVLAGHSTSCAKLGFDSHDTCKNWEANSAKVAHTFVRVREPNFADIIKNKELRKPWKDLQAQMQQSSAVYDKTEGYYYYFFAESDLAQAETTAKTLSDKTYVQATQGKLFPIQLTNLEETTQTYITALALQK